MRSLNLLLSAFAIAHASLASGFDEDFKLPVDYIAAAQVGYFFDGQSDSGFYGKLIYQLKQQTVTHRASGAERALVSHLIGPEVGYEWDLWAGLFVRPRLGVLYYAKSPQPGHASRSRWAAVATTTRLTTRWR